MHQYESRGSGYTIPYVWAPGQKRMIEKPLTYKEMASPYPTAGCSIAMCGPDAKPAEAAPEDDGLPTAETAAMDLDSPPGIGQANAPAASGREAQPAEVICIDGDEWHVVDHEPYVVAPPAATAETAPAA